MIAFLADGLGGYLGVCAVVWAAIAVHLAGVLTVLGRLGGSVDDCSRSFSRCFCTKLQTQLNTAADMAIAVLNTVFRL